MRLLDYERWVLMAREALLNVKPDIRTVRAQVGGKTIDYGIDVDAIVITGMGGSGVIGDILQDLCWYWDCRLPIYTVKHAVLPKIPASSPLVIAISYSGNTTETIKCVEEALKRGYPVIGVTTGGRLGEMLRNFGLPVVGIPRATAPRYALPGMLYAALAILELYKAVTIGIELEQGLRGIEEALRDVDMASETANWIKGYTPVFWVPESRRGIGIRLKNDLNENAKYFCIVAVIPESSHNDLAAITGGQNVRHLVLTEGVDAERPFIDALMEVLEEHNVEFKAIRLKGSTPLETELYGVTYVGLISLALAEALNVDPVPIKPIERIRALIERRQ